MKIGRMLMVSGTVLLVMMALYLGYTSVAGIPTPIGIAGTVRFQNGTVIPSETIVWAENTNTGEKVWRETQNGRFAIPISARDGDKIWVWTTYGKLEASVVITANMSLTTHWANLTLGKTQTAISPYWLLLIPIGMVVGGYAIEKRNRYR